MKNKIAFIGMTRACRERARKMLELLPHKTFVEINFHASPNFVARPSTARRKDKK